jgi:glycolate oxidase iron-sulfur subunit
VTVTPAAFTGHDTPDTKLIDACVHCGFCLPACPTYALWGEEMDSPRGRIYLMQAAIEGRTTITDQFVTHFDRCLGCVACVTACPSGVEYGPLLETTRAQIETHHRRSLADRLFRGAAFALFPYRARMRLLMLPLVITRPLVTLAERTGLLRLLPRRLGALLAAAPPVTIGTLFSRTPARTAAAAPARQTVGLLTGCVQQLIFPETNMASARVLAAEGCDVVAPPGQGCCGALSLHAGRLDEARAAARATIATFEAARVDRVISNAAGCGSAMKEYGHLLKDDPAWATRARDFSARVRDISEQLDELGPPRAMRQPIAMRVVYQDACHLAHAQGVRSAPRALLSQVPGLTLIECADDMCCGSAGIYNLLEPEAARPLGDRKLEALQSGTPEVIATANPGCRLQLASAARRAGRTVTFMHPIEILDRSIRGR